MEKEKAFALFKENQQKKGLTHSPLPSPSEKSEKTFRLQFAKSEKLSTFALPNRKKGESGPAGAAARFNEESKSKKYLLPGSIPDGGSGCCPGPGLKKVQKEKEEKFSSSACRKKKASYLCNPKQKQAILKAAAQAEKNLEKRFGRKKINAELWPPKPAGKTRATGACKV